MKLFFAKDIKMSPNAEASQRLGEALVSGDFTGFETLLDDDVTNVLYGCRTIYGKESVISYWQGWKKRYVDTFKTVSATVLHSKYYSDACLKLGNMIVLFHIKESKVDRIVLSSISLAPPSNSFNDNLLEDLPFDYEYIKKRLEPSGESDKGINSIEKEHRLPCMSCGLPSEKLEWGNCIIYTGIHGYLAQVSICPNCGKVVEFYPKIRLRFEEPQIAECDLLDVYAKCWNDKNTDGLSICLSEDFRYSSAWVFEELGKEEYLDYFEGKLEAIEETRSVVKAEVKGNLLVVSQNGRNVVIDVKIKDGKIVRADMTFPGFYGIPDRSQD